MHELNRGDFTHNEALVMLTGKGSHGMAVVADKITFSNLGIIIGEHQGLCSLSSSKFLALRVANCKRFRIWITMIKGEHKRIVVSASQIRMAIQLVIAFADCYFDRANIVTVSFAVLLLLQHFGAAIIGASAFAH